MSQAADHEVPQIIENELTIKEYKYLAELVYSQKWYDSNFKTGFKQEIFRKLGKIVYDNGVSLNE